MDIDTMILNMPLGALETEAIVKKIAAVPADDNIHFEIKDVSTIIAWIDTIAAVRTLCDRCMER